MLIRQNRALLFSTLLAIFSPYWAHCFSLTPMTVSFEPSGKDATKSFVLDNNSGEKLAVQVSMAERKMGLDGQEKNPEVEDSFMVYPPQLILGPREKRTVRVSWTGNAKLERELAYRIIAEQLPVETEKPQQSKGAVIRMLLKYQGAVYITPPGAKPKVVVASAEQVVEKSKKGSSPRLAVTLENQGTAHQILKEPVLKVKSAKGQSETLKGAALESIDGQNILAGGKRKFVVNWPERLPAAPVQVEIEFKN